ncbi:MAG: HipA domain-containing protein, partial [Propionibacteriaceae bacterium]|nr:HipA domain-containing protein [Propionibacteriaceae bacterium]
MTSDQFVWAWLPGHDSPVPCGRVWAEGAVHLFRYGRSYRERTDAMPLFGPPLTADTLAPPPGMRLHGVLRDALPDAWGQHVILARLTGRSGLDGDTGDLTELTYMRESASDRFGALDFQDSPDEYVARHEAVTLGGLAGAALALEQGQPLSPALDAALAHATTIGGARPKATLSDGGAGWIAKFASTSDGSQPRVRHEALGLELSRRCGVRTADFRL